MKRTKFDHSFDAINIFIMAILLLIMLYPLYYTIIASFSDPYAMLRGEVFLGIKGFTFASYKEVFKRDSIWTGYLNTSFYTVAGTILALAVTIPCGYALSRRGIKGKGIIMGLFVFTMYFSGGMIPFYILVKGLGLLNTRGVMIIPAAFSVYNMIVVRTFYQSTIPEELYEAAMVDGGSQLYILTRIVLPLSSAIIAVISLYVAVGQWNSYFNALIYIDRSELYPLQLILRSIIMQSQKLQITGNENMSSIELQDLMRKQMTAETMKYSLIIISSLPMLIAYPFVQKHFVKGVMIGAIKG